MRLRCLAPGRAAGRVTARENGGVGAARPRRHGTRFQRAALGSKNAASFDGRAHGIEPCAAAVNDFDNDFDNNSDNDSEDTVNSISKDIDSKNHNAADSINVNANNVYSNDAKDDNVDFDTPLIGPDFTEESLAKLPFTNETVIEVISFNPETDNEYEYDEEGLNKGEVTVKEIKNFLLLGHESWQKWLWVANKTEKYSLTEAGQKLAYNIKNPIQNRKCAHLPPQIMYVHA